MAHCPICGEDSEYVVDALLPDPDHSAYACQNEDCQVVFQGCDR